MSQFLTIQDPRVDGGLSTLVSNSVLEVALIILIDLALRSHFRRNPNPQESRRTRLNLLLTQEALLLLTICLILLFHHTPYLVMSAASIILFRIVQLKWYHRAQDVTRHQSNAAIGSVMSRPIKPEGSRFSWFHRRTPDPGPFTKPQQCTDDRSTASFISSEPSSWTSQSGSSYTSPRLTQDLLRSQSGSSYTSPRLTQDLLRSRHPQDLSRSGSSTDYTSTQQSTTSLQVSCSQSTLVGPRPSLEGVQVGSTQSTLVAPHSSLESVQGGSTPYQRSTPSQKQPGRAPVAISPRIGGHYSSTNLSRPAVPTVEQISLNRSSSVAQDSYSRPETGAWCDTFPSTTPPGLINNGNTCFVNSILQCLNWTPGFVDVLSQYSSVDGEPTSAMFSELNGVFHSCSTLPDGRSRFRPVSTRKLLSTMSRLAPHLVAPPNSMQSQQDAAEYLLWLLDHLHCLFQASRQPALYNASQVEEMVTQERQHKSRINELGSADLKALLKPMTDLSQVDWELHCHQHSSALYNLLLGQILEARECQSENCKKVTMNIEYFTLLPLPLPAIPAGQISSLDHCFQLFSDTEILDGVNRISCSCTTGLVVASRLALLSITPKLLVIQLTRFHYDSKHHRAIKNDTPISFPQHMNIFPHTMKAKLNNEATENKLYTLHAFCVHSGAQTTSFGHYVAYCKAFDNQWYQFNDQHVTYHKDIETILQTEFVLRNAYLLFYHSS